MNPLRTTFSILLLLVVSGCTNTPNNSETMEIEQILKSPASFLGQTVQIQGVVNQANAQKQLFSVISPREFEECGIGSCNVNEQLPIRYSGNLPEVGKRIQLVGRISQVGEGFIYEAESVKDFEAISANE